MHKIHPKALTVNLARMALGTVAQMMTLLPADTNRATLGLFPRLFDDATALQLRFVGYEKKLGIELTDAELYTLYISLDMMGRIFTSNYREVYFDFIVENGESVSPDEQQFIVDTALPNVDNFFKVMEQYAEQSDSLKELPNIKWRLRQLPMFD